MTALLEQTGRPTARPARPRRPAPRVGRRMRRRLAVALTVVVLSIGAVGYLMPFFWMLSTSLKAENQVYDYPITWVPDPIMWANFPGMFTTAPFVTYLINTVVLTSLGVLGSIVGSSMAAYGFARFRFRGRSVAFGIMLATMMIPIWVTIVPSYILFARIGWIDTYLPLLVPGFFAAPFNTFLMRQFFLSIPQELDEAARIDGAGSIRIFLQIILPLSKPVMMIVGLYAFLNYWNDFLGPLIFLQTQSKFPISLGIMNFVGSQIQNYPYMMAAAMLSMLPCLILYAVAQKWFIQGVVITGVKG